MSGCSATLGSEEITRLQYSLARVHKQASEAIKNLEKKELALEDKTAVLEEEIRELKKEVAIHRQALAKIQPEALAGTDWSPPQERENQLFQVARNDFLKGQYSLAIMGFKEYLRIYPKGRQVAEAQYWLAESFFSQEDFKSAVEEFDRLVKNYPRSQWVAPALYKKALGLVKEDRFSEAILILDEIIKRFPKSNESRLSQELKKELETQVPKSQPH